MRVRIGVGLAGGLDKVAGRWKAGVGLAERTAGIAIRMSWRRSIDGIAKWLSHHAHRHPASRLSRSTRGILDVIAGGIATHVTLEKAYLTVGPRWAREGISTGSKVLFAGPVVTLGYALTAGAGEK